MPPACAAEDDRVLVSAGWLADRLRAPKLKVVDASWHMPATGRDARAEYGAAHIPGAAFFDIDAVCDRTSPLPHMLPGAPAFADAVGGLGISEDDQVVVYDTAGIFSAPRAWWMFRAMGHEQVAVLDGGLPAWRAAGGLVEDGAVQPVPVSYTAIFRPDLVADAAQVEAALASGARPVLDARPAARFSGDAPEPRPGLKRGHMPGAVNVPFAEAIAPGGTLGDPDALAALFAARGVDARTAAITTCGSGVTAAILSLALARIGARDSSLYDGSWAEWGACDGRPAACG